MLVYIIYIKGEKRSESLQLLTGIHYLPELVAYQKT